MESNVKVIKFYERLKSIVMIVKLNETKYKYHIIKWLTKSLKEKGQGHII
jgi:hypothetical protein